ncbi:MAG: NAD(P)-dependent oxidoreductase [Nitrososphaeria archaeon]
MSSILITGGTGKLGRELVKIFPNSLHPTHNELDITNEVVVREFIKQNLPDIIIHTAAMTDVRRCEEERELAWKVNVNGTENLVKACLEYKPDCYFLYISTACVFHGDKGDYVETDIPYPKNFYSLTKLLGEFVVKYSGLKKWLIIRTNFVAREKWPYPKAFTDRYGTYLFADDLALAIKSVINEDLIGIVHICGEKKMSMFELAKITTPDVKPITLAEYYGPPLTKDMSLRSIRLKPFKIKKDKNI